MHGSDGLGSSVKFFQVSSSLDVSEANSSLESEAAEVIRLSLCA